jgi:hypothetical protein
MAGLLQLCCLQGFHPADQEELVAVPDLIGERWTDRIIRYRMRYSAVKCGVVVQYRNVQYGMVRRSVVWYDTER